MTSALPDPDLPAPLQQHPWYGQALADIGMRAEVRVLPGRSGQVVLMRSPLGALAVRGPVWREGTGAERRREGLQWLARGGLRLVEAEAGAVADLRALGWVRLVTPAHVAELDLTGDAAARLARAEGKWRNRRQRAQGTGLRLCAARFDPVRHAWLPAAEAAQRRARRYHGLPPGLAQAWATGHPGAARLYWAEARGQPVAGMLVLRHGPVATYHIGWSGPAGREAGAHHLILMQAADDLAGSGVRRLDLGSVDTEGAPGLARFKIGSGAAVRALGGSWLRLPFRSTGLRGPMPLWGAFNRPEPDARHGPDDPFPLRGPGPAPDGPAPHHRAGAGPGR